MAPHKEPATDTLEGKQLPTGFLGMIPPSEMYSAIPRQTVNSTIHTLFESVAEKNKHSLALQDESGSLTFEKLNELAKNIALAILASEAGKQTKGQYSEDIPYQQTPAALLLGQDIKTIAGMLGVLKTCGFFIVLDPAQPWERLNFILEDSTAPVLITDDDHMDFARILATSQDTTIINLNDMIYRSYDADIKIQVSPDALCSLTYTSGSTGRPKGVKRTHRDQLHAIWQDNIHYQLRREDRFAALDSLSAGGTFTHMMAVLLSGGSILLYDLKQKGLEGFYTWLERHRITVTLATTTLFRHICQVFAQQLPVSAGEQENARQDAKGKILPKFRLMLTGGEPVRPGDIKMFQEVFPPHVYLRVGGGSTEAMWIAESFVNRDTVVGDFGVPWGYIAEDKEVLIWDEDGKLVPKGQIGEVVVKSRYLSPGYWRRPELDREIFSPSPDGGPERLCRTGDLGCILSNGMLVHHGRSDYMIKVRGFRVELTEIETALLRIPQIKETIVIPHKDRTQEIQLVAYIVPYNDEKLSISEIRRFLMEILPDYMIPASYIFLDAFPLTTNLKLDRASLPKPPMSRPNLEASYTAPRTPLEGEITAIWSEILGIDQIGVLDPFLELGGDSLLAMRIISRIASRYPAALNLSALLKEGTVAGLAQVIEVALSQEGT
jgi:acyl-CoA synthetase (AMP-forming)/AMP-acid ligase II